MADRLVGVRAQSGQAIQQMLRRVIRGIPDEGLRIDDEPWRSTGAKDIPRVQIRRQQHADGRTIRGVPSRDADPHGPDRDPSTVPRESVPLRSNAPHR